MRRVPDSDACGQGVVPGLRTYKPSKPALHVLPPSVDRWKSWRTVSFAIGKNVMRVIAAHVFFYTGSSSRDADDPEVAGRLVREDPCRIDAIRE